MSDWQGVHDVIDDRESEERFRGERAGRFTWVVSDEALAECRAGYRCIGCMEKFRGADGLPEAWPERCPVCFYPVRERQAFELGPEQRGEVRVGPQTSDADELERLDMERERRIWTPGSSIRVP